MTTVSVTIDGESGSFAEGTTISPRRASLG
jgi:hypothetical protein